MTGGLLVYKCRMCGKLEKTLHVPGVVMAVVNIIHDIPQPKKWGGFNPGITSIHACGDGITGVSDLIGGEEDKPTA